MAATYNATSAGQLRRTVGDEVSYAVLRSPDGSASPFLFHEAPGQIGKGLYKAMTPAGTVVTFSCGAPSSSSPSLLFRPAGVYLPYTGRSTLEWAPAPGASPQPGVGVLFDPSKSSA